MEKLFEINLDFAGNEYQMVAPTPSIEIVQEDAVRFLINLYWADDLIIISGEEPGEGETDLDIDTPTFEMILKFANGATTTLAPTRKAATEQIEIVIPPSAIYDGITEATVAIYSGADKITSCEFEFLGRAILAENESIDEIGIWKSIGGVVSPKTPGSILKIGMFTTAERDAIAAPTEGMMVYNTTTHKLNFYDGTEWAE